MEEKKHPERKVDERGLQQKAAQLELLNEQVKALQREHVELSNQLVELEGTKKALAEIKKIKEGSGLLIPLGGGFFASGLLKKEDKIMVNLGADVAAKKSVVEAERIVDGTIKERTELLSKIRQELQRTSLMANRMYLEMQRAAQSK